MWLRLLFIFYREVGLKLVNMGPKKNKERDTDHSSSSRGGYNNGRADPIQTDHELFLQAFESKWFYFFIWSCEIVTFFADDNLVKFESIFQIWE